MVCGGSGLQEGSKNLEDASVNDVTPRRFEQKMEDNSISHQQQTVVKLPWPHLKNVVVKKEAEDKVDT